MSELSRPKGASELGQFTSSSTEGPNVIDWLHPCDHQGHQEIASPTTRDRDYSDRLRTLALDLHERPPQQHESGNASQRSGDIPLRSTTHCEPSRLVPNEGSHINRPFELTDRELHMLENGDREGLFRELSNRLMNDNNINRHRGRTWRDLFRAWNRWNNREGNTIVSYVGMVVGIASLYYTLHPSKA